MLFPGGTVKSPGIFTIIPCRLPFASKGKVKVKFSLCLTKHHAMKTYWGSVYCRLLVNSEQIGSSPVLLYKESKIWSILDRKFYPCQSSNTMPEESNHRKSGTYSDSRMNIEERKEGRPTACIIPRSYKVLKCSC